MDEPILSSAWYRVASLKPRLRSYAQIHHHIYRGQDWYVLQDHASGRFHRFSSEAYLVIGLMDGERSLDEIWETVYEQLGDDAPTQDEVIALIAQLYRADVLQTDLIPDITELHIRSVKGRRSRILSYFRSPLALRFPLWDPDRFLDRTKRFFYPLFSWFGLLVWIMVVFSGLLLAAMNWSELTTNVTDRVFAFENLFLIGLIYPVVKAFHEFGHAYSVKRWGGEVHEMGIMLLVFVPIPYLDASSASAFREKRRRFLVGAAGLFVELFLAAAAMITWVLVEPGVVRAAAFNVMLIAGVSSIFFNGNPLLRYDAYYVFSDLIEIPNLGTRANAFISYLVQRYTYGVKQIESPASTRGEALWLAFYAVASTIYRMFIVVAICLIAASKFFVIGILIAAWAAFGMIGIPILRWGRYLFSRSNLGRQRTRAIAVSITAIVSFAVFIFAIPLPLFTNVEGVVWAPEQSEVRTGVDGFVTQVLAKPGEWVTRGVPLFKLDNYELVSKARILEAELREYQALQRAAFLEDRTQANIYLDDIDRTGAELKETRELLEQLTVKSEVEGVFIMPNPEDMPGRYLHRGAHLGYVTDFSRITVRAVVPQSDVDRVRNSTNRVEARLAENIEEIVPATVVREVPQASSDLPSMALSLEGGGNIALDPSIRDEALAFERYFQFEIRLSESIVKGIGGRVYIRFEHDPEPLAFQWYRNVRRLLLSRFSI